MIKTFQLSLAALFTLMCCASCSDNGGTTPPGTGSTAREPGWHQETWDAGYGSWASGGIGQRYSLSIPNNYGFTQKLGQGWVSADLHEDNPIEIDDLISLGFGTDENPWPDVNLPLIKKQMETAALTHPELYGPPTFSPSKVVAINGLNYERVDVTTKMCLEDKEKHWIDLHGFWMKGNKIMLNVAPLEPRRLEICERIVASLLKI